MFRKVANRSAVKQSRRLEMISAKARDIRIRHQKGELTTAQASQLLLELRNKPEQLFNDEKIESRIAGAGAT